MAGKKKDVSIKVLRKDYYHDDANKIVKNGFSVKELKIDDKLKKHYSGNTLKMKKKDNSYSTFDDGLLF